MATDPAVERAGVRPSLIFVLGAIAILMALLIPIPVGGLGGRVAVAAGNLVHAPLFGSITLTLLVFASRHRKRRMSLPVVFGIAVAVIIFGFGIEVVQTFLGRIGSLHDGVANCYGVVAAVIAFYGMQARRWSTLVCGVLLLLAGAVLAYGSRDPVWILIDAVRARAQFPMLASFESRAEFSRFYFRDCDRQLTRQNVTDGRYAMELLFANVENPATRLHEIASDWSDVVALHMDLHLDRAYQQPSLAVMITVVDRAGKADGGGHFWQMVELPRGADHHLRVGRTELINGPVTRKLDLSQIRAIDLIAIDPAAPAKVRVDAIRLELRPN